MKKIGYYITYYSVYSWMYLHSLLPLKLLYILSDILYCLVYKLIGYRVKVVRKNLKNAFPEKSNQELIALEKEFYHHFCDYFVETIKLLHISNEEAEKRIVCKNTELVKQLMQDGKSCLMFLGHYGNWEWVPALTNKFSEDKNEHIGQIYRRLKNKAMDDIFLKIRSRFGSFGIEKNDTLREIIRLKKENKRFLIAFIADQSPSPNNIYYWTNFLNQDTAVFTGVERIAKKADFAVIYLDMVKKKRGYYECSLSLITDDPASEPEFAITEMYIRKMEKTILRNPAYWLWTHKRWKYTREMIDKMKKH